MMKLGEAGPTRQGRQYDSRKQIEINAPALSNHVACARRRVQCFAGNRPLTAAQCCCADADLENPVMPICVTCDLLYIATRSH